MKLRCKKFCGFVLVILGVLIAIFGYYLGLKFIDCGCGCCGGITLFPNSPTLLLYGVPEVRPPTPEACRFFGCSGGTTPLFLDLFGASVVFFLVGTYCLLGKKVATIVALLLMLFGVFVYLFFVG